MFSLFAQNPKNMSDTFVMWLNGNRTIREVPVHFQFSQSEKLDCIHKQILQLKVFRVYVLKVNRNIMQIVLVLTQKCWFVIPFLHLSCCRDVGPDPTVGLHRLRRCDHHPFRYPLPPI